MSEEGKQIIRCFIRGVRLILVLLEKLEKGEPI